MTETYKQKHPNFGKLNFEGTSVDFKLNRAEKGAKRQDPLAVLRPHSHYLRKGSFEQTSGYRQKQVSLFRVAKLISADIWCQMT